MIQKILCSTDGTAYSKDGVAYAFSLAQRNRAELIVFHAMSFPSIWEYPCEPEACYCCEKLLAKFSVDRLLDEGERKVKRLIFELGIAGDCTRWKARVALGRAADEIIAAAAREEVDLIVMDRRRRSWLARAFTRGIVEKVSRNAPCPVLLLDGSRFVDRSGEQRLPVLEEMPSY